MKKYLIVARAYDKRSRLISRAINSYTHTHPLQVRYAEEVGQSKRIYLHAEIACLLRAETKQIYKLVIERYLADGTPVLAKPCPICSKVIQDWGVKLVEYIK